MRVAGIVLAIVAGTWAAHGARAASAQPTREYGVKAAFVYSVMKFVEWPTSGLPPAGQSITVAVLGREAGQVIQSTIQGQLVGGRPIRVVVLDSASDAPACQVLFIADEAALQVREALSSARGRPVLTFTEAMTSRGTDAVVSVTVVNTKLVFDVDLDAARANRLKLSSHLLRLARKTTGTVVEGESR